ncbi:hypothetical protein NO1_1554 [Candidatus Termititenax aidoneus]|uniref:Uncharacterized protein n=1 Tax=Termititenax aidoneus TaxID=2218524 RepID=A0A388TCX9_TERA1|nr:hypothetical protein NO1_1554 [Candidatus Termititenax aidoneus]
MHTKIIIFREICAKLRNGGLADGKWSNKSAGQEAEEYLFSYYKSLKPLRDVFLSETENKRNNDRYTHTLRLPEHYLNLLDETPEAYEKFLSGSRVPKNEPKYQNADFLSRSAFQELQKYARESTAGYELFFLSLLFMHDYGTLTGTIDNASGKFLLKIDKRAQKEKQRHAIAVHPIYSARMCRYDFSTQEGLNCFSPAYVDLAELILANHSYFGDLLLGEAPFSYYAELKKKLAELHLPERGLNTDFQQFIDLLLLLTMLDCHSVNRRSYLDEEKYAEFMFIKKQSGFFNNTPNNMFHLRLHNLSPKLLDINTKDSAAYKIRRQLLEKQLHDIEIFHHIYLQYFKDLADLNNEKKPSPFIVDVDANGVPAVIKFLNQLCHLYKLAQQKLPENHKNQTMQIAFHSTENTEEMYQASQKYEIENSAKFYQPKFSGGPAHIIQGQFLDFSFTLSFNIGYLEIHN